MTFKLAKIIHPLLFIPLWVIISCSDDEIVYPKGGYPYLENITPRDSDFYFLPIRHTLTREDSFKITPAFKDLFRGFNEQNLSLRSPQGDIFRLIYTGSHGNHAVIRILKNKIEIKVAKSGSFELAPDLIKLNAVEKTQFDLLYINYHRTEITFDERRKRYADSLIKIYPELLDPLYYRKLLDKLFSIYQGPFIYSTKEIKITNDKYKYLVALINNSEFWERPFHSTDDEASNADGYGLYLEAITKNKYQCIMSNMYLDGPSKFRKACDELIKYTGIANEISWTTYEEFLNRPVKKIEVKELELTNLKEEPAPKPKKKKAK